jgi:hypothetical protein
LVLLSLSLLFMCASARAQGCDGPWLTASDRSDGDWFGTSVSISGDFIVVGAPGDDDRGLQSGSAYIEQRVAGDPTSWVEVQKIVAGDGAAGDYFGLAVAVSGDVAVIGAPFHDAFALDGGAVYVYRRSGATWSSSRSSERAMPRRVLSSAGASRSMGT